MEKSGETDLQAYLDRMSDTWKTTWEELGIVFDTFVRTTEPRHLAAVSRFWNAVKQSGDIYESVYEGLYCVGCEGFKTETETVDGKCPLHPNSELSPVKEKNYFFRASAYREALLNHLDENSQFVQPESRRNEIRNYITEHFTDFSISREAKQVSAGIPVPEDSNQRIYVWFDALINYLTVTGYGTDDKMCAEWWPADIHLIGKDILKFHCALWPAMLMSAAKNDPLLRDENGNPKLPTRVFAHGYFTINGQKSPNLSAMRLIRALSFRLTALMQLDISCYAKFRLVKMAIFPSRDLRRDILTISQTLLAIFFNARSR